MPLQFCISFFHVVITQFSRALHWIFQLFLIIVFIPTYITINISLSDFIPDDFSRSLNCLISQFWISRSRSIFLHLKSYSRYINKWVSFAYHFFFFLIGYQPLRGQVLLDCAEVFGVRISIFNQSVFQSVFLNKLFLLFVCIKWKLSFHLRISTFCELFF